MRDDITKAHSKIKLDIGCGANLAPGWVGLDIRAMDYHSDRFIQHDIESTPWPLPDSCASMIQASHIMEHISPVVYYLDNRIATDHEWEQAKLVDAASGEHSLADFNVCLGCRRVSYDDTLPTYCVGAGLKKRPGIISFMDEMHRVLEHEGQAMITGPYGWSQGFVQDPTHTKPLNEALFAYFTPIAWTGERSILYDIYKPKPWAFVQAPQFSTGVNILVVMSAQKK